MDQQAREQAFMNALATEHFVLQAARSAIVGEQVGRGSLYLGAVSSAPDRLGIPSPSGHPAGPVRGRGAARAVPAR
jgi:hypothetical protein